MQLLALLAGLKLLLKLPYSYCFKNQCTVTWSTALLMIWHQSTLSPLISLIIAELSRAKREQRSPWARKFGAIQAIFVLRKSCGVRPYVRPPLNVSRVEILHFKYTRISAVNRSIATRTLKKNNNKADSFFRLNFKVYIGVDNRERARARDKKTKETNFV